jgi:nucleoside-diphosphate-sugar epimerase
MKFTIFGRGGFIGRNLSRYLEGRGHKVWIPSRAAEETRGQDLGHVIYAIGLTGDFRSRPFDTVEAHVCKLLDLLMFSRFDSWLYLSSTRIYGGLPLTEVAREDTVLNVSPNLDGVYNISKLMGEALCLALPNKNIRVVRLANVYGSGQSKHTFLASIVDELVQTGKAVIREAPESEKDYIALTDVLPLLEAIALSGRERLYNVASGKAVTHAEFANKLIQLTGRSIQFEENAPCRRFPLIDISRIQIEFDFVASGIDDNLPALIATNEHNRKKGGSQIEQERT